jgi:hypothetical protein
MSLTVSPCDPFGQKDAVTNKKLCTVFIIINVIVFGGAALLFWWYTQQSKTMDLDPIPAQTIVPVAEDIIVDDDMILMPETEVTKEAETMEPHATSAPIQ